MGERGVAVHRNKRPAVMLLLVWKESERRTPTTTPASAAAAPDPQARHDLLEIPEDHYGRRSNIVTSQMPKISSTDF
jgi:hypothetical protein